MTVSTNTQPSDSRKRKHKFSSENYSKMTAPIAEKSDCIFCNIVNKFENTQILYEDDDICVFPDIKPASKLHLLIIPKRHIEDVKCLTPADKELGKSFYLRN